MINKAYDIHVARDDIGKFICLLDQYKPDITVLMTYGMGSYIMRVGQVTLLHIKLSINLIDCQEMKGVFWNQILVE
jgi:hypothetical protein